MNNYEWSIENTLGSIGISVNKLFRAILLHSKLLGYSR